MTHAVDASTTFEVEDLSAWYGDSQVLHSITMGIPTRKITAVIGPSGCGKSTFLRCLNRMNDFIPGFRLSGRVLFNGRDIYERGLDPIEVRICLGMVFQKPNPFPKSVYDNVAYGPRLFGVKARAQLDEIVERCLRAAALWSEVSDVLRKSALSLSGGQQQRLCIARALATEPEALLMDEPCSALDPTATAKIEDLMQELKKNYTVVIVTHNMQQAARVSDLTGFFLDGRLIEFGPSENVFTTPEDKRTEDYITGRFG